MVEYTSEIKKYLEEGAKAYAAKNFELSVEHYGDACQLFSQTHDGEEDPHLLHLYGKALFQLAQSRNGLFGGGDAEGTEKLDETETEKPQEKKNGMFTFSEDVPLAEETDSGDEQPVQGEVEEDDAENEGEYQDENQEQEQEQEQEQVQEQVQEPLEEQTDFEVAWEVLDLARTLFEAELPSEPHDIPESPTESTDPAIQTRLKLSDIYDLLGEISLETENFKQAAEDFESLLKIRESIYPFESNMVSEAHYKLSLALEFNFEDEKAKEKAVDHLKKAISSIKKNQEQNADNKNDDLIKDLEIRLEDLQKDPNELFNQQKQEILKGILGEATGSSSGGNQTTTTAPQQVNDLTSMVKKRKAKPGNDATKKLKK
jgi:HAT1-interacting factor 1